jgi:HEAT repeat protein
MKPCRVGMFALLVVAVWVGPGYARGIDSLIQDLKTGDETTRIRAVVALGRSGDPAAVESLREALSDESRLVRQYALHALTDLLRVLEHASHLVSRWLHDLREQLEQRLEGPQTTAVRRSIPTVGD